MDRGGAGEEGENMEEVAVDKNEEKKRVRAGVQAARQSVSDEGEEDENQKQEATATGQDQFACHSRPAASYYFEVTITSYIS